MPFSAIDSDSGEQIFIEDYLSDSGKLDKDSLYKLSLVDPFFYSELRPRIGHFRGSVNVRPHFYSFDLAKKALSEKVFFDDEYIKNGTLGESIEHKNGKEYILSLVRNDWSEQIIESRMEKRIQITKKGKYRIADVYIETASEKIAFECQLSPISTQELTNRINDYLSEKIYSYWFLGNKARTKDNIELLESRGIFYGGVDIS
jgi:hypothetical protein